MGRKSEFESDPSLGREHEEGAIIQPLLISEHASLGTICIVASGTRLLHHAAAKAAYRDLRNVHDKIAQLPVDESSSRLVGSDELIAEVYDAGTRMVIGVVLTIQHLAEEIERSLPNELSGTTVEDRLSEALRGVGIELDKRDSGYAAFHQIRQRRDAVEHPKSDNTHNSGPTTWDMVPLAWFVSERAVASFEKYLAWIEGVFAAWHEHSERTRTTQTYTVERGIRSKRQFKKPPR